MASKFDQPQSGGVINPFQSTLVEMPFQQLYEGTLYKSKLYEAADTALEAAEDLLNIDVLEEDRAAFEAKLAEYSKGIAESVEKNMDSPEALMAYSKKLAGRISKDFARGDMGQWQKAKQAYDKHVAEYDKLLQENKIEDWAYDMAVNFPREVYAAQGGTTYEDGKYKGLDLRKVSVRPDMDKISNFARGWQADAAKSFGGMPTLDASGQFWVSKSGGWEKVSASEVRKSLQEYVKGNPEFENYINQKSEWYQTRHGLAEDEAVTRVMADFDSVINAVTEREAYKRSESRVQADQVKTGSGDQTPSGLVGTYGVQGKSMPGVEVAKNLTEEKQRIETLRDQIPEEEYLTAMGNLQTNTMGFIHNTLAQLQEAGLRGTMGETVYNQMNRLNASIGRDQQIIPGGDYRAAQIQTVKDIAREIRGVSSLEEAMKNPTISNLVRGDVNTAQEILAAARMLEGYSDDKIAEVLSNTPGYSTMVSNMIDPNQSLVYMPEADVYIPKASVLTEAQQTLVGEASSRGWTAVTSVYGEDGLSLEELANLSNDQVTLQTNTRYWTPAYMKPEERNQLMQKVIDPISALSITALAPGGDAGGIYAQAYNEAAGEVKTILDLYTDPSAVLQIEEVLPGLGTGLYPEGAVSMRFDPTKLTEAGKDFLEKLNANATDDSKYIFTIDRANIADPTTAKTVDRLIASVHGGAEFAREQMALSLPKAQAEDVFAVNLEPGDYVQIVEKGNQLYAVAYSGEDAYRTGFLKKEVPITVYSAEAFRQAFKQNPRAGTQVEIK